LAQRDFSRSAHAYDQSLLSKIGKNSPPHHRSDSTDSATLGRKLSLQTRDATSQQRLKVMDLPSGTTDSGRWITSPSSAAVSPSSRLAWRDYSMRHPSPSNDTTANSLVLDPELFLQARGGNRPTTTVSADDTMSVDSRSQRGSYDQAMFGSDQEFTNEDHKLERRASRQGMKRRALSPPIEGRSPTQTSDPYQKVSAVSVARSPTSGYRAAPPPPSYGSMSTTTSRHGSYASSFAPSIAASSMTSVSSMDRQSPSDPSQGLPFITSAGPVSSPATSIPPSRKPQGQYSTPDNRVLNRKLSIQSPVNDLLPTSLAKIGNHYICECCPKKPRKFETEEQLRQVKSSYKHIFSTLRLLLPSPSRALLSLRVR
jgi:hypothetical protein